VDPLKRLHARQTDIAYVAFEELFAARVPYKLIRISTSYQSVSFNGTFGRWMRGSWLLMDDAGQT